MFTSYSEDLLDPYCGSGIGDSSVQNNPWYTIPHPYNYSTHAHPNYPDFFSSSYLRPYPLPLSLSYPIPYTKRKGGQVRFTPQQTQNLERRFGSHQYLTPEDRRVLANQLKLTDRQVKTWFQNRRAKWRRSKNSNSPDSRDECEIHTDDEVSTVSNGSPTFTSPRHSPMLTAV